jgi:hypothetical protein
MLSIGIGAAAATRSKARCIITEAMIATPAPAPARRDGGIEQADSRVEVVREEGVESRPAVEAVQQDRGIAVGRPALAPAVDETTVVVRRRFGSDAADDAQHPLGRHRSILASKGDPVLPPRRGRRPSRASGELSCAAGRPHTDLDPVVPAETLPQVPHQ